MKLIEKTETSSLRYQTRLDAAVSRNRRPVSRLRERIREKMYYGSDGIPNIMGSRLIGRF